MRRITALLVLATALACGGGSDATSPGNTSKGVAFSGNYVLQTVNGNPLPATWYYNSGDSLRIRSYSISINGSGGWTSTVSQVFSANSVVTDQPNGGQSGSYTYDAGTKQVSLFSTDLTTPLSGSVSTDFSTLTIVLNSDRFVFKR